MISVNIRPWFAHYLRDSIIGIIDRAIDWYLNYRFASVQQTTDEAYEEHWIKVDRRIALALYTALFLFVSGVTTICAAMLPTKKN